MKSSASKKEDDPNFSYVANVKKRNRLRYADLADLAEYSPETVRAWFAEQGSSKHRRVPSRAVTLIRMKLKEQNSKA